MGYYSKAGELYFSSRKDFQIKHMGHRIELGEIDMAINAVEGCVRACCIFDKDNNKIIGFYEGTPDKKTITHELMKKLPKFMIPQEFGREIDRLYKSEDFSCIMDIVNNYIGLLEKSFGKEPATSHREIETVKNYIHNHYGEEIGAQQLADMVYLAPSYLSSLFKKETGQNLSKYIKQYRMEKAKELLTGTNMKIVNISEQVGYPNVSYFVQSFREYFGVSPQKFRDQGELS